MGIAGCQSRRFHPPYVAHYGALHELMHGRSRAAVVELDGYAGRPGVYAVGALAELAGEVTVLNGEVWISRPDGAGGFTTTHDATGVGAALLVQKGDGSDQWPIEIALEHDTALVELNQTLGGMARARGLDTSGPFPFLIEAECPRLEIHVVDGTKILPNQTPEQHYAASVQLRYENMPATLIGFHSTQHVGVFTHLGQTLHVHAVVPPANVTGHVEDAVFAAGTVIRLATIQ